MSDMQQANSGLTKPRLRTAYSSVRQFCRLHCSIDYQILCKQIHRHICFEWRLCQIWKRSWSVRPISVTGRDGACLLISLGVGHDHEHWNILPGLYILLSCRKSITWLLILKTAQPLVRCENGKTTQNSKFLNTVNVIDIDINNTSKNLHLRVRLNKACGHGTGCLLYWVYLQVGYILKGGGWPVKSETFWPHRLTHWIHERVTKQMWKVPRRWKLQRRPTSLTVPSVPRLLPTCVSTGSQLQWRHLGNIAPQITAYFTDCSTACSV